MKNYFGLIIFLYLLAGSIFFFGCAKQSVDYCGENEETGAWTSCDTERYNVDGPAERLLAQGVSKIIMVDMTVGGVRFFKTFQTVQMVKRAVAAWEEAHPAAARSASPGKIGVLFTVHGGFAQYSPQALWDVSAQMFSYDPNHPVHLFFLWNPAFWNLILSSGNAEKEQLKYAFNYERLGGTDPFPEITDRLVEDLQAELDILGNANGLEFVVDWVAWMSGDDPSHYPFPRYMYDPDQYYTVDFVTPETPVMWVNDYSSLMERSYPVKPENWTSTSGKPDQDNPVPLDDNSTNPVAEDQRLAAMFVDSIEASLSADVSDNETGILFLDHATRDHEQFYDPKIDDTQVVIDNIKTRLLAAHPGIDPANIVGSYMGIKELNPENGKVERSRDMRGENLGHAYLYESNPAQLPDLPWGYLYWDALEYLKDRGVKHIVVCFPQIVADSVLNLVEIHNQIGKEIGYKNWLYWEDGGTMDNDTYPGKGHPFADYWGIWVDPQCDDGAGGTLDCCFKMGGCPDNGTYANNGEYPPERQDPLSSSLSDMDPSLAYDVSEYGHLGYDPNLGSPDKNAPVQNQYTGTWAMYVPPNDAPEMTELLADHVLNAALGNLD